MNELLTLDMAKKLTFVDLFSGIGGFHYALHKLDMECVAACEIDSHARATYEANYSSISPKVFKNNLFFNDVRMLDPSLIGKYDILCAGFPCQPFSQAGHKRGFGDVDDRGNMFFEIMRIVKESKPKVLLLENVRHLENHDGGNTFKVIKECISKAGYTFDYKVMKASEHGLPQHRPRIYIVAFRKDLGITHFEFPKERELQLTMSDLFQGKCTMDMAGKKPRDIGFTLRVGGKASGVLDRRNWDAYIIDGKAVKLTSKIGLRMMGFPRDFKFPVSETQAMKQLGNSVAVNCVFDVAAEIKRALSNAPIASKNLRKPELFS